MDKQIENLKENERKINEKGITLLVLVVTIIIYVVDNKVNFNEREGKVILLRDEYNKANIYQTTYRIDEDDNISLQVGGRVQTFIEMCKSYIGITAEQEPYKEKLYGDEASDVSIPLEESIYVKNRLYSITYRVDNANLLAGTEEIVSNEAITETSDKAKEYDINFYRVDNTLVCEFVNLL